MGDNENKNGAERGKIKSMIFNLFVNSENNIALSKTAPPPAEHGISGMHRVIADPLTPGASGVDSQREAPLSGTPSPDDEPAPKEKTNEPDNTQKFARESSLYALYNRRMGLPPVDDTQATFPLSQFIEDDVPPSDEQRSWIGQIEAVARELLKISDQPHDEADDSVQDESLNASVFTYLSRDKMRASIFSFPPTFSGRGADEAVLRTHLEAAGVLFGLDEEKIKHLGAHPVYFRLIHVACGQEPVNGENGQVIDQYSRERELRLRVREDNTIDYKDLGWLQTISEGETICLLEPPTEAITGQNVIGGEVRGKNGKPAVVPMGQYTKINEDNTALIAALEGVVSFASGRFRVDPLLTIKGDICTETGNLDTIGDILVHGDIQEGFTVQATGNITVQGMIEGATVMADGDIQVGRGVNGNSHGVLQAKGEVRSKFIENATVVAEGKIICDTIINSTISSDTGLFVTTGRGAIIGGHITALERIEAKSIGNQSNRSIIITMGSTANFLRERHEWDQKKQVLEAEVQETQKNIHFLEMNRCPSPELLQLADDQKLKLSVLKMQLANATRHLEGLNQKHVSNSSCRLCAEVLYPTAQITIGDATRIIRNTAFNATVYYNKGEIDIANV